MLIMIIIRIVIVFGAMKCAHGQTWLFHSTLRPVNMCAVNDIRVIYCTHPVEYTSADKDNDSDYKWRLLLGTINTDTVSGCKKVKTHWMLIGCSLSVNISCFFLSHCNVDIYIFWISKGIKRKTRLYVSDITHMLGWFLGVKTCIYNAQHKRSYSWNVCFFSVFSYFIFRMNHILSFETTIQMVQPVIATLSLYIFYVCSMDLLNYLVLELGIWWLCWET